MRDLLDGCSDEFTQMPKPGPPEDFGEDYLSAGVYVRVVLIWIVLIIISAYGICNGIIASVWFCFDIKCRRKTMQRIENCRK